MELSGRVALVTGGSRGIGKAIVQRLASHGAKVAFVYQSAQAAAETVVSELMAEGKQVVALQGDASKKPDADAIVEKVLAKWAMLPSKVAPSFSSVIICLPFCA